MENRKDVITAIEALLTDLKKYPDTWENPTLESFLEAMAAWVEDWGEKYDSPPSWEFVIQMLNAAKVYE
jgi:hypothetical protein